MKKAKYRNPIPKPEMVTIPKWEYRELVEKATMFYVLRKLSDSDKKYAASELLEVLFEDKTEVEE